MNGKLFVRKVGSGVTMVIGIIDVLLYSIGTEFLYGVRVINVKDAELRLELLDMVANLSSQEIIDAELREMGADARIFFRIGFAHGMGGKEVTMVLMTLEQFPAYFENEALHAVCFQESNAGFLIRIGVKEKTDKFYGLRADQILCEL